MQRFVISQMLLSLDRKLLRDLRALWGQAIAIALVIASGVATFVNSQNALRSLESTRAAFYERSRFAEVFAGAKRVPDSMKSRLEEIPGVAHVETRIVEGVNLDIPDLNEPALGQLISVPDTHPPLLNQLYLRRGRWLKPGADDEVLASEKFAAANELDIGDTIAAIINGRRKQLRIVGVVLSPEYVFQVKPGDIVPDPKHYGVMWMNEEALSMAFDMEGAFNDVAVELLHGANIDEVIFRMDELLDPYGGRGAFGRKDQISHMILEGDIRGLKTTGLIAPTIFLCVAAFLFNVVLTRTLALQREQIAALKAFGYTNFDIAWHYIKFVLVITLAGAVLGTVGGNLLAGFFTEMLARVYQYPEILIRVRWSIVALAISVAATAALLGASAAIWRAVRVPPAEAMRPEPPANFKPTLIEQLGLGRMLPNVARMVLRQLQRQRIKTCVSIFAVGLSVGIIVVGQFMQDAIDYVTDLQYNRVQLYDIQVNTVEPLSTDITHALASIPGVMHVEPMRSVPARVRYGPHYRRVAVQSLPTDVTLTQLMDRHRATWQPPPAGLVMSKILAEQLGAKVGDLVSIEVLEGKRPTLKLPVLALLDDIAGLNVYTSLDSMNRLLREAPRASGAYLRIDQNQQAEVYQELKEIPALAGVSVREYALQSFQDTIAQNMGTIKAINLTFAVIIALGVVYNGARIALSERSRELATLRVIGFTRHEISAILLGELGVITVLALPLGMGIGWSFAYLLSTYLANEEAFRFPFIIEKSTYGLAVSVVLTASVLSALLVRRKLDHLDLIAVLKSRE
ncbi:FtsX-like permease family protein [Aeoliella sp. ICT_H6.2]|uniref:FtsX-like permease family protein n=2 Tax=Aeoliella straminimaris TaxID=2954799 RepID=A0A9X2FDY5_9BACT|nr:FtsX-like permease family protein [Aeoliella straminimaris]